MLEIRLTGPIQICSEGQVQNLVKAKKGRWLMALLALRLGHECSRDWLAETLWPEQDLLARRSYLSHTLVDVRRSLGADSPCIQGSDPRHLNLDADQVSVDLSELDQAIEADPLRAIGLYAAPLFEGCDEPWAIEAREARQRRLSAALERLAETRPPSEAAEIYRQIVRIEPLHEGAQRGLMSALSACGRESEAIAAYREFKLRLHRELNAIPSGETEAAYARISRPSIGAADRPRERQHAPGHKLPSPLSDLVGRDLELAAIAALMEGNRLVTLIGFGGSGKTRLAIETGRRLWPAAESGVWFVDLSALTNPLSVAETVGETLGIGQTGDQSWKTRIIRSIGNRHLAIILDNCEHVIEPAALLAGELLDHCPNLRLLATSREPLGVPGERLFSVPPLELPGGRRLTAGEALSASAVRLFQDRARQVRSEFEVTDLNAVDVAEICRRLDGIPLAIEMAAASIAILSPADILSRLDARFKLLRSGRRLTAPRQQSLQALIDWSYRLLDERERVMLARLSVFSGGWTAEAADQVVPKGPLQHGEVLDVLGSLVAKSLVQADVSDRGSRFRLLETVREYAGERLTDAGEVEDTRDRHYAYFLSLARQGKGWRMGLAEAAWFNACDADYDNLRSAVEWGFSRGVGQSLAIVAALSPLWHRHGHMSDGLAVLERALALPSPDPASSDRLEVMKALGNHLGTHGSESTRGISILQEMVALARTKGDRNELATALGALGNLSYERASEALHEALQVIGEDSHIGRPQQCLNLLALRALRTEHPVSGEPWPDFDLSAAEKFLERSLALCVEHGDLETQAWTYHLLGQLKDKTSGSTPALPFYSRADRLFRKLGVRSGLLYVTWARTEAYVSMSDFRGACDSASEMLVLAIDFGHTAAEYAAYLLNAEVRDQVGDASGADEMIHKAAILHLEHAAPYTAETLFLRASDMCSARGFDELAARLYGVLPKDGKCRTMLIADNRSAEEYRETRERIRISSERAIGARRFQDLVEEGSRLTFDQAVESIRDAFS